MLQRDVVADSSTAEEFRRPSPQCSPCGSARLGSGLVAMLVPGIISCTFIPFVLRNPALPEPWALADVTVFLVLLSLLVASWLQAVFIDAGTTPAQWHDMIANRPASERNEFRWCTKTNMYRPPRSHFDSVTRRVVLNMDHFCPWVANTVGFYNRKFFVLFLVYTFLTTGYAGTSSFLWHGVDTSSVPIGGGDFTSLEFSLLLNTVLCVTVGGFAGFHIKMVLCNETSIELGGGFCGRGPYNVGWRANLESVAGKTPWLWLVPVYGSGPVGDGINWPTSGVT